MSTRAVYSFLDDKGLEQPIHVYKHADGYPTGARAAITAALKTAWPLPRYEHDEFAAAFVAANKGGGGQVRLIPNPLINDPSNGAAARAFARDLDYRYEIRCHDGKLWIQAFAVDYWDSVEESEIFSGPMSSMLSWAKKYENGESR
jgi:hypothetical protein